MPLDAPLGLPMALALGLLYGLGPCLISCLPYLGPVFLGHSGGIRQSWRILLPLSLGRLTIYGGFGAVSGWWGSRYVDGVDKSTLHGIFGLALVLLGIALWLRRPSCGKACPPKAPGQAQVFPLARREKPAAAPVMPLGLYLLGISLALTPCAPMSAVLVAAAGTGSPALGAALGVFFGLGAIVVPSLVYGLGAAYVGTRLRQELGRARPILERLAACLLIFSGLANFVP